MATRRTGPFRMDRRAFFGAAAASVGAGLLSGAAADIPAGTIAVEPDLTDATANAPGYSGQPRRRPASTGGGEPLDLALGS